MMLWAAKVRADADTPDEPEDAPHQGELFAEGVIERLEAAE